MILLWQDTLVHDFMDIAINRGDIRAHRGDIYANRGGIHVYREHIYVVLLW